jgi:hypothetical protein
MENIEIKGKVTKWLPDKNWGVVNYYTGDFNAAPSKAFLHMNNVISTEKPELGSRIMFVLGPPRSATELPVALKVRVIPSPAVS